MSTDPSFWAWFEGIPNLGETDNARSKAQPSAEVQLGRTLDERMERTKNAHTFAKWLNGAAGIAAIWGFVYPRPYEFVILVLAGLPLLAFYAVMRSRGLYDMGEGHANEARPNLLLAFLSPGIVLFARALTDASLLEFKSLLLWTLAAAAVITLVIARNNRSVDKVFLAIWFAFGSLYSFGVMTHSNALLDRSEAAVFEVMVQDKHTSGGRTTTHYLLLDPWGPVTEAAETPVAAGLYGSIDVGDTVCVYLLSGALRIPWYAVSTCG